MPHHRGQKLTDLAGADQHRAMPGGEPPGHLVLEGVLVVSAAVAIAGFVVWFFFFAGTSPYPLGITL